LTSFHRYLGAVIVVLFLVIMLWGLVLRLARREDPGVAPGDPALDREPARVQVVTGLVLLFVGRRVIGGPLIWFHYLYGSLFPLIAIVGGRIAALRRERREFVGLAWGAFIAFALTLRAVQTACGDELEASCAASADEVERAPEHRVAICGVVRTGRFSRGLQCPPPRAVCGLHHHSGVAQLAERSTVNRDVAGSSPAPGANRQPATAPGLERGIRVGAGR
jgi:hypothetical protein